MTAASYLEQLLTDDDFFVLETQKRLATSPEFFDMLLDPYDKKSYFVQREALAAELDRLYSEEAE